MSKQANPITIRTPDLLDQKVDQYVKKNKEKLRMRRLASKTALVNWFWLELVEGRIDPCRKQ